MPSITTIAAGAALAGAATSAFGTIEAGQAQASQASYQSQVARNNAAIAQQKAGYAAQAGEAQAQAESLKNAAQLGDVKTAQAANNIDVNTGSAVDVQKTQREIGEYDTATTMNNALLQAYGYQTEATSFQAESGLESAEASQAPIGAGLSAGGGLLSNAGSIGLKWLIPNSSTTPQPTATGDW